MKFVSEEELLAHAFMAIHNIRNIFHSIFPEHPETAGIVSLSCKLEEKIMSVAKSPGSQTFLEIEGDPHLEH